LQIYRWLGGVEANCWLRLYPANANNPAQPTAKTQIGQTHFRQSPKALGNRLNAAPVSIPKSFQSQINRWKKPVYLQIPPEPEAVAYHLEIDHDFHYRPDFDLTQSYL